MIVIMIVLIVVVVVVVIIVMMTRRRDGTSTLAVLLQIVPTVDEVIRQVSNFMKEGDPYLDLRRPSSMDS